MPNEQKHAPPPEILTFSAAIKVGLRFSASGQQDLAGQKVYLDDFYAR
jgi:hypothetical protein